MGERVAGRVWASLGRSQSQTVDGRGRGAVLGRWEELGLLSSPRVDAHLVSLGSRRPSATLGGGAATGRVSCRGW